MPLSKTLLQFAYQLNMNFVIVLHTYLTLLHKNLDYHNLNGMLQQALIYN